MDSGYVHGYVPSENRRLQDQANTLVELLHSDIYFPEGSIVLEAGCGVGAQTIILAQNSPGALITSIDICMESVSEAEKKVKSLGIKNVRFQQADFFKLDFSPESFDHIFVCFELEHLSKPLEALILLKNLLKTGGTMTVIEGDHGSAYFYPDSPAAKMAIQCQVELQKQNGGNAMIGRELYPLMKKTGLSTINVSPKMVYVDSSKPDLVEGFTKNTFTAMIRGVREKVIMKNMLDINIFDAGINDLYKTTEEDGVFCYTFFKATGIKN